MFNTLWLILCASYNLGAVDSDFVNFMKMCREFEISFAILSPLKVSKFQKQIFLFSFEPKNERNCFLNSVLASKMSQSKKMKALY